MYIFEKAGAKMKAVRESKGLSKYRIAKRTGLSYKAYFDIENGKTDLRLSTLWRIADALEVEPTTLLV